MIVEIDGIRYLPEPPAFVSPKTFGTALKEIRIRHDVSLDIAAEELGISKTYLWELETAHSSNPSFQLAIKISRYYSVPLEWLASSISAG